MITIHDIETGEVYDREMTADEIAQIEIDKANAKLEAEALLEKEAQKAALLAKLGITEDEAKLLLS